MLHKINKNSINKFIKFYINFLFFLIIFILNFIWVILLFNHFSFFWCFITLLFLFFQNMLRFVDGIALKFLNKLQTLFNFKDVSRWYWYSFIKKYQKNKCRTYQVTVVCIKYYCLYYIFFYFFKINTILFKCFFYCI